MAGPVDPARRLSVIDMFTSKFGLHTSARVAKYDISFIGETEHFLLRVDYSPTCGGGYQIFEGVRGFDGYTGSIEAVSKVMGKGRVTPRFQMTPQLPVRTNEEIEEERRSILLRMEYEQSFDEDRTG